MKKIKFRAWDAKHKLMYYSSEHHRGWRTNLVAFFAAYEKAKHPLMMFSGLRDANEKDIWEADIVQLPCTEKCPDSCNKDHYHAVQFENGSYWNIFDTAAPDQCVIVGNLWENPELVQASEE